MNLTDWVHRKYIHPRRVRVLAAGIASLLPDRCSVLDVGTGDGWVARLIHDARPGAEIVGIDTQVRQETHIPVVRYDGMTIPFPDGRFDVVLFVDVLHHAPDPRVLLGEGRRVGSRHIIVKDHTCQNRFDAAILRWMDDVGNTQHGVPVTYRYESRSQWAEDFASLDLVPSAWIDRLGLYPAPVSLLFERRMHFVARLDLR